MRDVVAWLQFANVDALVELRAFDVNLGELTFRLSILCEKATAVATEAASLGIVGADRNGTTFSQRVVQQCGALAEIATALATLRRVAQSWGIAGMRDPEADVADSPAPDSGSSDPGEGN